MSSFLETQPAQFAPYRGTIDPSVYAQVGMMKQSQYDANVAKINAYFEQVAGIEAVKDSHKQYLNEKVNALNADIQKLAGGDFANQQLVNQSAGLISKVAKDPVVQNIVLSTSNYKKGIQQIQEAQKKGTYDVRNETYFNDQVQSWLSNPDNAVPLSAQYTPYTDITKEFLEIYKEIDPSSNLTQEDIVIDESGVSVINERSTKGITAEKVQAAWDLTKQRGNVQQQLLINGHYDYRGRDKKSMVADIQSSKQAMLADTDVLIKELEAKQATDKTVNPIEITNRIKFLKTQAAEQSSLYDNIMSLPESQMKKSLYEANLRNSLVNTFANSENTQILKESPIYSAKRQQLDYELSLQKFNYEKEKDVLKGAYGESTQVTPRGVPQEVGMLGEETFKQNIELTKQELNYETRKHINSIAGFNGVPSPWKLNPEGVYIPNVGIGGYASAQEAQAAHDRMYTEAKIANEEGRASDPVRAMFSQISPIQRTVQFLETKASEIESRFPGVSLALDTLPNVSTTVVKRDNPNNPWQLNKQDILDIWLIDNKRGDYSRTEEKLIKKFGSKGELRRIMSAVADNPLGNSAYDTISQTMRNSPQLLQTLDAFEKSGIIEQRKQLYKDAQAAYVSYQEDFITPSPKENQAVAQRFKSVISQVAAGKQEDRGPYNDFMEAIEEDEKGENLYGYYYDKLSNNVFLTVKVKGEDEQLSVPIRAKDAMLIPGIKVSSDFDRTYESALALTGNTTTDVNHDGGNAYDVPTLSGSKYTVKYHLAGTGGNEGNYMFKLYVWDKEGNQLLNGTPYSPLGTYMNKNQIVESVGALSSDRLIDEILNKNKPQ